VTPLATWMVQTGLLPSLAVAREAIARGHVRLDGQDVRDAGLLVPDGLHYQLGQGGRLFIFTSPDVAEPAPESPPLGSQ
jgi:ribosomal 50S subunit-recycling heat shock protein